MALGWKALHEGEGLEGAHWSGCRRREEAGKNNRQAAQPSGLRLGWGAGTTHCACPTLCVQPKSLQSCPTLCDPWTEDHQAPRPWDSPGKKTGMGCRALLLQGIFPIQESNSCLLCLLHLQVDSLLLAPPRFLGDRLPHRSLRHKGKEPGV